MASVPTIPADAISDTKPSMGDAEFVDSEVKAMLDEARKMLFAAPEGSNPQVEVKALIAKWADRFFAGNTEFVQTMTPEAQAVWLQQHGLGTDDTDPKGPITCLVAETLKRFSATSIAFAEGEIDEDQLQFQLDAAAEDCTMMLLGLENQAD